MKANWIICDNHLALKEGTNIYHLSASEVYSFSSNNRINEIECESPFVELPSVRFSKIGTAAKIRLTSGVDGDIYFNEQTNEFDIWFEDSFMRYVGGIEWNTPNNPYTTMFVNQWFKTGTKIVLDELFEGFSANGLDIRYNANVGLGLHIIIKLN